MHDLLNTSDGNIKPESVGMHPMCIRKLYALLRAQDLPRPSAFSR